MEGIIWLPSLCDGHLSMCHNLNYMAQRKYRTLTEWQQQVLVGRKGKEAKQLLNPFKDLKINELWAEIEARGLGDSNKTKPALAQILNEELKGATRNPALLFGNESVSVESLNLQSCEVLYFEAFHCFSLFYESNRKHSGRNPHHISDIDTLINTSCST